MEDLEKTCRGAAEAASSLISADTARKDAALSAIADKIRGNAGAVITENEKDVKAAAGNGRDSAFLDRLTLDEKRIEKMAASVLQVMNLADPIGSCIKKWKRPNGLEIEKVRVPIGVIAIIYEARPDVSAEASALCLKSGNCVILRGGSDAFNTNRAVVALIREGLEEAGFSPACVQMLNDVSHDTVLELLKMSDFIDLVIPRGGESLIEMVTANSRIPVIKHYKGVCHIYVDNFADLKMAESVCFNAKVQRPSVCNAMETMLVHKEIAGEFLPKMLAAFKAAGVEIRGDENVKRIAPWVKEARDDDRGREYLSLILNTAVVESLDDAVSYINTYGSSHSDAIITRDYENAKKFLAGVDSAAVYVNASTRFTDGGEFGFGAEMGISTDKLHARGPMALEELTSYKYLVYGSGQIRE